MDEKLIGGSFSRRHRSHSLAAILRVESGDRTLEAGVVVEGHLVADVVASQIDVIDVAGRLRAANERAVQNVTVVARCIHVAVVHPAGTTVVRVQRRIVPEPHDIAAVGRIVPEHVVDLLHRKIVIAAAVIGYRVAIDQCNKRCVGGVPQRPPCVEEGQPAGGVLDPSAGVSDRPVVEPPFGVCLVELPAGCLGQQHSRAVGLVVPRLRPLQLLAAEARVVDRLRLGEIGLLACRLVEPDRPPRQFVGDAAE